MKTSCGILIVFLSSSLGWCDLVIGKQNNLDSWLTAERIEQAISDNDHENGAKSIGSGYLWVEGKNKFTDKDVALCIRRYVKVKETDKSEWLFEGLSSKRQCVRWAAHIGLCQIYGVQVDDLKFFFLFPASDPANKATVEHWKNLVHRGSVSPK